MLRTALDALAAGFAFAVPAVEILLPDGLATAAGDPAALVHPASGVVLATAAVAVIGRARRPGGLPLPTLLLLGGGAMLLGVLDLLEHHGVERGPRARRGRRPRAAVAGRRGPGASATPSPTGPRCGASGSLC